MVVTTEALGVIDDQAQAPAEAQLIALQLRPHWEHYRHLHTAGDLGEMTRAILRELGAVNVREGSGWWFAPLAQRAALERLRWLIEGLPVVGDDRPFVLMLGQLDAAATRRQLARAAFHDFMRPARRGAPGPGRVRRQARRHGAGGDRGRPAGRLPRAEATRGPLRRPARHAAGGRSSAGWTSWPSRRGRSSSASRRRRRDPAGATLPLPGLAAAG